MVRNGYWRGGVEHVDEHQTEGHQQHYSSGDHVLQCEASEIKKQLMKKYLIVLCTERNQKTPRQEIWCLLSRVIFVCNSFPTLYNKPFPRRTYYCPHESHEKTLCLNQNFSLEITMKNCVRTKLNLNQMDLINEWNQVLDIAKSELKCYTYFSCL